MKIYLTLFICALILLFNNIYCKEENFNSTKKNSTEKNSTNTNILNFTRKHYQNTEKSAEKFLKEITQLVISDFEILKENKIEGISLKVLKHMIHNDTEFLNNITDEEIEKKFKEYDLMKKGFLDKISYSGILSEFMIAKAALKNLNKFFEDQKNVINYFDNETTAIAINDNDNDNVNVYINDNVNVNVNKTFISDNKMKMNKTINSNSNKISKRKFLKEKK